MAASHKFSKTIEVKIETGDDEFENKYEDIMDTALKRGKKQSSSKINEAANVPDDASPRTKRKMQNRYYCQINRRKKKEYVVELEEKIESLEKEIVQLNKKINSLYTKINAMVIGDDKDLNELNEIQTFSRNMAVKELQEGHDLIRLQKRIRLLSSNTG